jgi:23S rRNA (uracil1939-C5)-methyltransferase
LTIKETAPSIPPASRIVPRAGVELDLAFTDLLANGQAVGRSDGVVVFCFGPLPGERARVVVTAVKPKYVVAKLLRLIDSSPQRVEPFCRVFGTCGGCQIQHLSYPAQLAWKKGVLREALQRIGGFDAIEPADPVGMERPRAYRNKMSLVVAQGSGSPAIGFYRQRSHDVVPIDECPVVTEQLDGYIARFKTAASNAAVADALRQTRHLVARNARATRQAVLAMTTARESAAVAQAASELLEDLPGAVGIVNSFEPSGENAILGRRQRLVAGAAEIEETLGGVRYRVSAGSFFQVNVEIVERIFETLQPHLARGRRIVDLYCGAGTFALYFAAHGCDVVGIEENAGAVAEARANAVLNRLQARVRFFAERVERAVADGEGRAAVARADVAFLDPPRKGSGEATLAALASAGVPEVWYLSCDPATLARDLKFLASKGYRLDAVRPFDMFPQTGHVEALAILRRSALDRSSP